MIFEIIEQISEPETIAVDKSIREIKRLKKVYGDGRWRKMKGIFIIRFQSEVICRAEVHWYEAHGKAKNKTILAKIGQIMKEFIICIKNQGYEASLELWKVYITVPDDLAKRQNLLRVTDESGEDYLFPSEYFVPLTLPKVVRDAMMRDSL